MANKEITKENLAMKEVLIAMHKLGGQVTRNEFQRGAAELIIRFAIK